jgi:hypothetical protein
MINKKLVIEVVVHDVHKWGNYNKKQNKEEINYELESVQKEVIDVLQDIFGGFEYFTASAKLVIEEVEVIVKEQKVVFSDNKAESIDI